MLVRARDTTRSVMPKAAMRSENVVQSLVVVLGGNMLPVFVVGADIGKSVWR